MPARARYLDLRPARVSRGAVAAALAGWATVALALPRAVSAQEETKEPVVVDYVAPDGCPMAAAFARDLASRTTRARVARPDEKGRILRVRLGRRGAGHVGTLAIEDGGGLGTPREVAGGTCAEVVSALALVAALAVDSRAATPGLATDDAPSVDGGSADGSAPAAAQAGAADRPANAPATPAPSVEDAPRSTADREVAGGVAFGVGAGAEVSTVADAVVSLRAFADLEIVRHSQVLAPSFRLAFSRSLDHDTGGAGVSATFRLTQALLDVCPLRFDAATAVSVRPCLAASAGAVEVDPGAQGGTSKARSRPWLSVSAHGRLSWTIAGRLSLEAEAGLSLPLLRESFFFEPNFPVYEAPPAAFVGRLGASLRFP